MTSIVNKVYLTSYAIDKLNSSIIKVNILLTLIMNFNLIVATDINNGIGFDNTMPWDISNDLKYFKRITTHNIDDTRKNIIVMGSKTWKQTGYLKHRYNIIISNTLQKVDIMNISLFDDIFICKSITQSITLCKLLHDKKNGGDTFFIGGEKIYSSILNDNILTKIYLTRIHESYICNKYLTKINGDFKLDSEVYHRQFCKIKKREVVISQCIYSINVQEEGYLKLLSKIMNCKTYRQTRNGETLSLFGESLKFDLREGYPLLTTKRTFFRGIVEELLFFLRGDTNTKLLEDKNVNIWKGNTNIDFIKECGLFLNEGDMGPMYGFNWRHYGEEYKNNKDNYIGIDQLKYCIDLIKHDPSSRRIIMTTYNPSNVSEGVLYPCHGIVVQFYINDGYLDCAMYQRSCDTFLGLPFNIASYALLMKIIGKVTNYEPRHLTITLGDTHIYKSHMNAVRLQLSRSPFKFPSLEINKKLNDVNDIEKLQYEDFALQDYTYHNSIKVDMVA